MDDYAREYAWYLEGCRLLGWEDPLAEGEFARLWPQYDVCVTALRARRLARERARGLARVTSTLAFTLTERHLLIQKDRLFRVGHPVEKGRGGDGSTPKGALLRPGPRPRGGSAASTLPPEPVRDL